MRAYSWSSLTVLGMPMQAPPEGPKWFIPVFETKAQAEAFAFPGFPIMQLEEAPDRNWTADFMDENGKYENKCDQCGETFLGYRGRAICFACYKKS